MTPKHPQTKLIQAKRRGIVNYLASLLLGLLFLNVSLSLAQDISDYSGMYTLSQEGITLTLTLKQDANNVITGSLTSTTGIQYALEGQYMEGGIGGICSDQSGSVYFEGYYYDNELIFSLMDIDAYNMPDYNSAQYLSFTKSAGLTDGVIIAQQGQQQQQGEQQQEVQQLQQQQQSGVGVGVSGGDVKISSTEIGDPSWGFKFNPPEGWVHQQTYEQIILGHNSIPGLIVVLPHQFSNMQELQNDLMSGLQDEGVSLSLSGNLTNLGNNAMAGEYSGIFQGEQVKARGIGTSSPFGGGAYIVAVTTPDKYGDDQRSAADAIAKNMTYFKPKVSDLMKHFAGQWVNFSSSGASTTWLTFYPDGSFSDQYEASYGGNFTNDVGDVTGDWGAYNQESSQGRWTVQGNKDQGQIIVTYTNGNQTVYNYQVHEERGQKYYSEYKFNGYLYAKK